MTSLFERIDKSDGMAAVLDHLGIGFNRTRLGWQKIECPNGAQHSSGRDRNPSCSMRLDVGTCNCHSCGFHGDWARIMWEVEGQTVDKAAVTLGLEKGEPGEGSSHDPNDLFRF